MDLSKFISNKKTLSVHLKFAYFAKIENFLLKVL